MQTRDLPDFVALMALLGELYGKALSKLLTELYWQALKGFEWEDVKQAMQGYIHYPDGGQFFPKPADIVRFIEGSGETKALQAWTKVEGALYQVGRYQSLVFDDCLIHAVIEAMGGWVKLCATTHEELPFRANEFQKRYMGFLLKKPNRYPKYLSGLLECENAKNGYPVEPPLLIGDTDKAKEVFLKGGGISLIVQTVRSIQQLLPDDTAMKEEENHDRD